MPATTVPPVYRQSAVFICFIIRGIVRLHNTHKGSKHLSRFSKYAYCPACRCTQVEPAIGLRLVLQPLYLTHHTMLHTRSPSSPSRAIGRIVPTHSHATLLAGLLDAVQPAPNHASQVPGLSLTHFLGKTGALPGLCILNCCASYLATLDAVRFICASNAQMHETARFMTAFRRKLLVSYLQKHHSICASLSCFGLCSRLNFRVRVSLLPFISVPPTS